MVSTQEQSHLVLSVHSPLLEFDLTQASVQSVLSYLWKAEALVHFENSFLLILVETPNWCQTHKSWYDLELHVSFDSSVFVSSTVLAPSQNISWSFGIDKMCGGLRFRYFLSCICRDLLLLWFVSHIECLLMHKSIALSWIQLEFPRFLTWANYFGTIRTLCPNIHRLFLQVHVCFLLWDGFPQSHSLAHEFELAWLLARTARRQDKLETLTHGVHEECFELRL